MEILEGKQKIIVIVAIIIVIGVIVYYYINSTRDLYEYEEVNEIVATDEEEDEQEEGNIIVHITGAVNYNGVVTVKENARINDVIEAAGGVTADADLSNVNLAYAVEDGQKIYIPSIYDTENVSQEDVNIINDEAGDSVIYEENETSQGLININTASQSELETLPGIGSSTASKIITYRTENGKFTTIEDIKNVSRNR